MQPQGAKKVKDRRFSPLQAGTIYPSDAIANRIGSLLIGMYKGNLAFVDLDELVNQPLVQVEQQNMLGILDGRLATYDLQTITIPNGSVVGAAVRARLTVPVTDTWYISDVQMTTPADQGGRASVNWRCSIWPDVGTNPDVDGQAFHAAAQAAAGALGATFDDEFHPGAPFMAPTNKSVLLRLPGGSVITFVAINTIALATADMVCTGALYGFRTTKLVQ